MSVQPMNEAMVCDGETNENTVIKIKHHHNLPLKTFLQCRTCILYLQNILLLLLPSVSGFYGAKMFINLTRQFVGVCQQTKSVGRAVILKYNPTQSFSIMAAPCLFKNRAHECPVGEERRVQMQCLLRVMEDTFDIFCMIYR